MDQIEPKWNEYDQSALNDPNKTEMDQSRKNGPKWKK